MSGYLSGTFPYPWNYVAAAACVFCATRLFVRSRLVRFPVYAACAYTGVLPLVYALTH